MKSIPQHSVTFKVHKTSTEIVIDNGRVIPGKIGVYSRGSVQEFSFRSKKRMRLSLENNADWWRYFIMLSYPGEFPCDGRKVKRDIQAMKRWLKRQGALMIFWGIEFQKRGAPHINFLIPCRIDKDKLRNAWYKIVGSGDPRHLRAGSGIQKVRSKGEMISYMIGYVGKAEQKEVPEDYVNVGRFWGCTKNVEESGTYTYRFKSSEALEAFLQPVVKQYEGKMNEWSKEKDKPYTWRYKGKSFVMWSGSDFINQFIEGGCNVEKEEFEKKTERNESGCDQAGNERRRVRGFDGGVPFCQQCFVDERGNILTKPVLPRVYRLPIRSL